MTGLWEALLVRCPWVMDNDFIIRYAVTGGLQRVKAIPANGFNGFIRATNWDEAVKDVG